MSELKPCPFCGSKAVVRCDEGSFQIVGCDTPDHKTMLCPSPSIIVYKKDGKYDYSFWNTRHESETKAQAVEAVKNKVLSDLDNSSDWWDYERVEKWFIDYAQQLRDSN